MTNQKMQKPSGRNICVLYFTDSTKQFSISGTTTWYKYARSAQSKAHENLVYNVYGAGVAVVYDDDRSKDLFVFVRHADNTVTTAWNHETMKGRYLGTTRDPGGDFTRKMSKTAKLRKLREVGKK